jgi:hypothetical protein
MMVLRMLAVRVVGLIAACVARPIGPAPLAGAVGTGWGTILLAWIDLGEEATAHRFWAHGKLNIV